MKCAEVTNDLLLDYSEWRLSPQERNSVGGHLEECRSCRVRKDEMEWMGQGMRDTVEGAPPAFLAQLDPAFILEKEARGGKTAVAPEPFTESPSSEAAATPPPAASPPALRQWLQAGAGAAAMLGVCIAVYFLLPPPGENATPSPAPSKPAAVAAPPPPIKAESPAPEPTPIPEPKPAPKPEPKPEPPPPPKPVFARAPVKAGPIPTALVSRIVRTPISHVLPPRPPRAIAKPVPPPPAPDPKPAPPEPPKVLAGDLTGDGVVDIADARRMQQALIAGADMPDHMDLNGDGTVDVADVRFLTRVEVGRK